MLKLYDYQTSGNCYKVRLLLVQLGIPFESVPVDLKGGEARTPAFRAIAPMGRVPVVVLESGTTLAESNAILWYFGDGTPYVPRDGLERAQVLQWMFYEQYSHEPYIAVLRSWLRYYGVPAGRDGEIPRLRQLGYEALDVMEKHLARRRFFVAERYSIADIALYAYTHVAGEGEFDLDRYPAVRAWIDRVAAEPGHVALAKAA